MRNKPGDTSIATRSWSASFKTRRRSCGRCSKRLYASWAYRRGTPVIDRFHLTERLALALQLLPMQKVQREQCLERWRRDLEQDDRAIDRIERDLRKRTRNYLPMCTAAQRQPVFADQRALDEQLNYIRNHKSKMRYASVRALGLPTGSGATEGACKSLVMIRAKRCGQRWHTRGISSVLALRSHYVSERLPSFWSLFAAHNRAELQAA